MSKKVVIAGSASLKKEMQKWVDFWEAKSDHEVIDYPNPIDKSKILTEYPKVHQEFFRNLTRADLVFVANEDKGGVRGYIGAETFAELAFAVAQNLVYGKNIEIILAKMPSEKVQSFEEVNLWLRLGWIRVFKESS